MINPRNKNVIKIDRSRYRASTSYFIKYKYNFLAEDEKNLRLNNNTSCFAEVFKKNDIPKGTVFIVNLHFNYFKNDRVAIPLKYSNILKYIKLVNGMYRHIQVKHTWEKRSLWFEDEKDLDELVVMVEFKDTYPNVALRDVLTRLRIMFEHTFNKGLDTILSKKNCTLKDIDRYFLNNFNYTIYNGHFMYTHEDSLNSLIKNFNYEDCEKYIRKKSFKTENLNIYYDKIADYLDKKNDKNDD